MWRGPLRQNSWSSNPLTKSPSRPPDIPPPPPLARRPPPGNRRHFASSLRQTVTRRFIPDLPQPGPSHHGPSWLPPWEDHAAIPPPPTSATAPVPGDIATIITVINATGARLAARRTLRPWESETHPCYPAASHLDSKRPRTLLPLRNNPGAIPVAPFQTSAFATTPAGINVAWKGIGRPKSGSKVAAKKIFQGETESPQTHKPLANIDRNEWRVRQDSNL